MPSTPPLTTDVVVPRQRSGQKMQDLVLKLLVDKDVQHCLDRLKQEYPNIGTRRNVLSKLRAGILEHNLRHDAYESAMKTYEDDLKAQYQAAPVAQRENLLNRLQKLFHFRACSLKRQCQLQKKLSMGSSSSKCEICAPEDRAFYLRLPLLPEWVHALKLDYSDSRELALQQQRSLEEQSSNVIRIENADDLVIRCRAILRSDQSTLLELATALALCTGRRMVEVFMLGEFVEHPHRRYAVYFRGQAKSGLRAIHTIDRDKQLEYMIPTLATGSSIVRAVSRMRGLVNSAAKTPQEPRDINRLYCGKLNTHVKKHVHPHITFHDLRTMYALMTFESFKPHRFSLNKWVANTLGHGSMAMSVHYTRMQIYGLSRISRHKAEAAEDFNGET